MGSYDKLGQQCTKFPAPYRYPSKPDSVFLDTQGLLSQSGDPDVIAAGHILLEFAVQVAASTKLVYVEDSHHFLEGQAYVGDMAKLVCNLVLSPDADIFCVFTKCYLPLDHPGTIKQFHEASAAIWNAQHSKVNKLKQRALELVQKRMPLFSSSSDSSKEEEEKETVAELQDEMFDKQMRYAMLIKHAFKQNHFVIIDPTTPLPDDLLERLTNIQPVTPADLNFASLTAERTSFRADFESVLQRTISPFLRDLIFCFRYPPECLEQVMSKLDHDLAKHENNLRSCRENSNKVELLKEYKVEQSKNISTLSKEITNLIKKQAEKEGERDNILLGKPIPCDPIYFGRTILGIHFWRDATVQYNESTPVISVEEILRPGVVRREGLSMPPFQPEPQNGFIKFTAASPQNNVTVKYRSTLGLFRQLADGLSKLFTTEETQTTKAPQDPRLKNYSGLLQFYIRPRDRFATSLQKIEEELEKDKALLEEKQRELANEELQNSKKLEDRIETAIQKCNAQRSQLQTVSDFVHGPLFVWAHSLPPPSLFGTLRDQILGYATVADILSPPTSSYANPVVDDFRNLILVLRQLGAFDLRQPAVPANSSDIPASTILQDFKARDR